MFLESSKTALDDEIVGFTENGGWQELNNLLPPLIGSDYFLNSIDWVCAVQILFDKLKVSLSVLHRDGL